VYEARQRSPSRRVALKVIRDRSYHARLRARFAREAEILAKLNHPGIATVYESGEAEGTPYVAMEYIDGVSITAYAEANRLSVKARAALLRDVAQAVGHAHTMGIVHRDIKPSNVLVDRDGRATVLDFGIALDTAITDRTAMTESGQLLGTLRYMAPEQIDRSHAETSSSTDVYALGLLGYELLSGRSAHVASGSSVYELIRSIRDDQPSSLGSVNSSLRGDLETIIGKALSREQDRRYENAVEMGADLERYLTMQPILARRASTWYQLRKFSRRNPALVGSVGAIMVTLAVAVVVISAALRTATRDREIAESQRRAQELTALFVTEDLFSAGDPNYGGDVGITLLEAMRRASGRIPERFEGSPEAEASISHTMGDQFRLMNDFGLAIEHLERSVELSRGMPGLASGVMLDRMVSLADVYSDVDDLDRALGVMDEVEAYLAANPGVSGVRRVDVLVQHGSLAYYKLDFERAGALFGEALEIGEREAPEHSTTIDAVSALAMVYTNMDRPEEAERLHRRGIEMRTRLSGPDHPSTLQAQDNYAIHLMKLERYVEGIALLDEIYAMRVRVFGAEHNKSILNRLLVGRAWLSGNEYALAEPFLVEGYADCVGVLGREHRYTLVARDALVRLYTGWGRPEDAARYQVDAGAAED
jgi:eukaryotic-like serine/threonine-protein kinase